MNKIICGNCLDIIPTLPDKKFQTICADVPYYILNKENLQTDYHTDIIQYNDFDNFHSYNEYIAFIELFVKLIIPKMKDIGNFICFFATQYVSDLIRIGEKYGLEFKNILVWYKPNPLFRIRKNNFISSFESIVYLIKKQTQNGIELSPPFFYTHPNDMHNCIINPLVSIKERVKLTKQDKILLEEQYFHQNHKKVNLSNSVHPTQKPVKLIKHLLSITTEPNEYVCDPFAGVGTTNKACADLGINCISIEKNPLYYKYAQERISKNKPSVLQKNLSFLLR